VDLLFHLSPHARVLDLGARTGSFRSPRADLRIVRVDLEIPSTRLEGAYVSGDAARLPFADASFDAVVSNHSLEHFLDLNGAVREIGRVLKPTGALYIAVPDASTLTDGIYRWLGRGGGHVNPFRDPSDITSLVERLTGLSHRATLPLISGLSFLNRHNFSARPPRKIALFAFGHERFVAVLIWLLKSVDRRFGTRLGHYGWAFWFGSAVPPKQEIWWNVCVRCGSGHPDAALPHTRTYACPQCGGWNLRSGI
jgi:SAM-dependent methyltransferase